MARHRAALIARNAAGLRLRIDPPALRQSRFADKRTAQAESRNATLAFHRKAIHRFETAIAARQNDGNVDRAGKPLRVGAKNGSPSKSRTRQFRQFPLTSIADAP